MTTNEEETKTSKINIKYFGGGNTGSFRSFSLNDDVLKSPDGSNDDSDKLSSFRMLMSVLFDRDLYSKKKGVVALVSFFALILLLLCSYTLNNTVIIRSGINGGFLFGSIWTTLTSILVIYSYRKYETYQRHPNGLLYNKAVHDLLMSLTFVFNPIWEQLGVDVHQNDSSCRYLSIVREYLFMNSSVWFFCMSLDFYFMITNPFSSCQQNMKIYYFITIGSGIFGAVVISLSSQFYGRANGEFCWVKAQDISGNSLFNLNAPTWILVYAPVLIIGVFSVYVSVVGWKRLSQGLGPTFKARRDILRQEYIITISYLSYWLILWIIYSCLWVTKNKSVLEILYGFVFTNGGQINFGLWIMHNDIAVLLASKSESQSEDNTRPQLNMALQKEILFITTKGIDQAVRYAEMGSPRGIGNTKAGESFFNLSPEVKEDPEPNDDPEPKDDPDPNQKNSITGTKFVDYKPGAFKRIRHHYGLTMENYLPSFQSTSNATISEGASGAFLFFSGDNAYIVKSMTKEESEFLRKIGDDYADYLISHKDTFITRFLGCYGITLYNKNFYFIVMENLFDVEPGVQINQRYDIKGSWIARNAKKPKKGKELRCRHCNMTYRHGTKSICTVRVGNHEPNIVLKDEDLSTKLRLGDEEGSKVLNQLKMDSDFLSSHGIMDYSLLIGVVETSYQVHQHRTPSQVTPTFLQIPKNQATSSSSTHPTSPSSSSSSTQSSSPSLPMQPEHTNQTFFPFSSSTKTTIDTKNPPCRFSNKQSQSGLRQTEVIVGPAFYYIGIIDILQTWNFRKKTERFAKTQLLRQDKHGISAIEPKAYRDRFHEKLSQIIHRSDDLVEQPHTRNNQANATKETMESIPTKVQILPYSEQDDSDQDDC